MFDLSFNVLVLTRLVAALIFGFGIGLEREMTNKYAGLRTHILVCLGSCVFTLLSIYAFPTAVDASHPQAFGDPARIAAQILTGIGFIGGGTVLRHGSSVYGLTTAATLWVAASLGMACGAGKLEIAFFATVFSVGVLVLIRSFEKNFLAGSIKNTKKYRVVISAKAEDAEAIYDGIVNNFHSIEELTKKHSREDNLIKIIAVIDINLKRSEQSLYTAFESFKGIESISVQEEDERRKN